jgi:hypothetical protein
VVVAYSVYAVAAASRAAARKLVSQYGARVRSDVEAALYRSGESGPPAQFLDPLALGSLIMSIAGLAWQIYTDRKERRNVGRAG